MPTHYEVITGLIEERDALAARLATLTAAGIVVGEDGAVRWHGLTGAEIEATRRVLKEAIAFHEAVFTPAASDAATYLVVAVNRYLAAAAGRGADGEAGE